MKYKIKTNVYKTLSDTFTPVGLYLNLRNQFANLVLLESSDYKSKENSFSYICFDSIATFKVENDFIFKQYPELKTEKIQILETEIEYELNQFINEFEAENLNLSFVSHGFFGYTSYDAIPFFKKIKFKQSNIKHPIIQYDFYRFMIVFNHFNNELFILEHLIENEISKLDEIKEIIKNQLTDHYTFQSINKEVSNFNDDDFLSVIQKGIKHCYLGDVFQIVLSRKFKQEFKGDEFNVYRALRSINPSPYLFYFDCGNFKIFGSSPEAQITIKNHQAEINPIAGTYKRTGNMAEDEKLAKLLIEDKKENAEHVMLVDLARNDLSINSNNVKVDSFKKVEFYSHVIHLVSKVSADLATDFNPIKIFFDTFPAGTLSGAPKHEAMKLIDFYEPQSRGFYGGAVGIIGLDKSINHAIFIRSFLSQNNELHYQAGCGIVAKSDPKSELNEVNNKLSALKKAIQLANQL